MYIVFKKKRRVEVVRWGDDEKPHYRKLTFYADTPYIVSEESTDKSDPAMFVLPGIGSIELPQDKSWEFVDAA